MTGEVQIRFHHKLKVKLQDYALLTKMRLASMVIFSAVIGFLVTGVASSFAQIFWLIFGGLLVTGAANAINQILEREFDKLMSRTNNRPLPAGRMSVIEAAMISGLMGLGGIVILTLAFNPLSGVIAALALLSYAFVYTPMKRMTPFAVFVGAIPGALPPLIGYAAATGTLDEFAVLIFALQFIWQFPHFWSIAWVSHDDYSKAGFQLLPSAEGKSEFTSLQSLIYTLVLVPLLMCMFILGYITTIGLAVSLLVTAYFLLKAVNFYRKSDDQSARQVMFASFAYLPLVLITLWVTAV